MSVIRAYLSGDPVHDRVIKAFAEGCKAELATLDDYKPSDVAVIFGVRKSRVPISWPRGEVFRRQREQNRDVVVLETGYINRGDGETHHYAAGFNGLNGRADFKNKGMPGDRAHKLRRDHGLRCLRWREEHGHILLCGQVPWDASVDHVDYMKWLADTAAKLMMTDTKVIFRPHPKAKLNPIPWLEYSTKPIQEDLKGSHLVIAFNSNATVEAVIEGVPAMTFDEGAMAWDVTSHSFTEPLYMGEREQWLNDLAYSQWTLAEMRSGEAWAHLNRGSK